MREKERERWKRKRLRRRKTKENGVNPAPGLPIYREGPPNLSVASPSTIKQAPTALSQKVREKLKADVSQTDYGYDLNLSLDRQPNKKITSGLPDGKHVLQAPTSY
jgi:hypothetical protein